MRNSTIIFGILFAATNVLFPAEPQRHTTQPQAIVSNTSWLGGWGSSGLYGSSPSSQNTSISPSTPIGRLVGAVTYVKDSVCSAITTVQIASSDHHALIKLGWPIDSPEAQGELIKSGNIYRQIETTKDEEKREHFLLQSRRRTEFLWRAYIILPIHPDRIALAQFLITHHSPAMSSNLKKGYESFIKKTAREALQASVNEYPIQEISDHKKCVDIDKDDAKSILLRLGFAMDEKDKEEANKILDECLRVYQIKKLLQKSEYYEASQTVAGRTDLINKNGLISINERDISYKMIQDPSICKTFISGRTLALRKIEPSFLEKLPGQLSLLVVQHCLKHHKFLLSEDQQGVYRVFIRKQQLLAQQIYNQFGSTELVTDSK